MTADLNCILPALLLMAGAFLIVLIDLLLKRRDLIEYIAYIALLSSLIFTVLRLGAGTATGFQDAVIFDSFSIFMIIAILASCALSLLFIINSATRYNVPLSEYIALLLLGSSGMILLVMSREFITLFLSFEIMSISVYILSGITRRDALSNEASLKYFVIGSFASAFLLYGMSLIYGATGTIYLNEIAYKLNRDSPVALAGVALMLIGFAFKIGAVPFHGWVPDVYEGAPTAVTAFMSAGVKVAGFSVLIRVLTQGFGLIPDLCAQAITIISAASMIVGNILALTQTNMKRMLAYSSIAHTGYALIGVATFSPSIEGLAATSFYLFAYIFMTLGSFTIISYAGNYGKEALEIKDFEGLAKTRPWTAAFMTIFLVSLLGIPPTAGFFSKFYIFKVAIRYEQYVLVAIAIATTILSIYYYLRPVMYMYMRAPAEERRKIQSDINMEVSIAICAVFTILIGILPSFIFMSFRCVRDLF